MDGATARRQEWISRPVRRLLLVEDDDVQRLSTVELIGNGDVRTLAVATGAEALAAAERDPFDCTVVDLGLPDMDGVDLIERLRRLPSFGDRPIIVYTARDLDRRQEERLGRLAQSIIVKDPVAAGRVLGHTARVLHRTVGGMPEAQRPPPG